MSVVNNFIFIGSYNYGTYFIIYSSWNCREGVSDWDIMGCNHSTLLMSTCCILQDQKDWHWQQGIFQKIFFSWKEGKRCPVAILSKCQRLPAKTYWCRYTRSSRIFVPFTVEEYVNKSQLAELHYTALLDQSNRQAVAFSIFYLFFLEGLLPHGVCLNKTWDCSTPDISFPFRIESQSYALHASTFWKHSLCFFSYVKICIEFWVRMSESWVSFTHITFK